jgi:glycosyltransferase involved in cell wall biosynthesis/O-antigen/teichoic acid export membrane protein
MADCGVRQALVQTLAADTTNHTEVFTNALVIQTLTSTAVALTIWAASTWFNIRPFGIPHYTSYLALYVLFQAWHQVLSGTLQGLRLYRAFAIGELSRSIGRLALIYILLLRFSRGLDGLLTATALAPAIASVAQLALVPVSLALPTLNKHRVLQLLKLAYPLGAGTLLGIASDRVSRVILVASHGPVAVAMLEIASKVSDASIQCYMGFQSAFFPTITTLLAQTNRSGASRALNDIVRLVAVGVALISIIVTMERDLIIKTLFSVAYLDATWPFALLFSALTIALTNNLLHTTIIASGDTKAAFVLSGFQTITSVGLCLVFIPKCGYLGAVYAYVGSNCAVNPLLIYRLHRLKISVKIGTYSVPCLFVALTDALSFHHRASAWIMCAVGMLFVLISVSRGFWRTATISRLAQQCEEQHPGGEHSNPDHFDRLRILVITERYPPHHEGGYEIACKKSVDFLRSQGHAITVLTSRYGAAGRELSDETYRLLYRCMPQSKPSATPYYIARELVRAVLLRINQSVSRAVCQSIRPDIIFAWQTDGIGIGTVTALQFQNCPIVYRIDDVTLALLIERLKEERNLFVKWSRYFVYGVRRRALIFPHMVAVSSFLERRYAAAGIPAEAITVIHNGTPDESVAPFITGVCRDSHVKLLVAGRVCHDKGVHVAIKAFAELGNTEPEDLTLDLVGPVEHSYKHVLESLILELGLAGKVQLCGPVSPESMLRLYDSYDIVLFPSLVWEGFGLTLLEAMARGRPVVAVNRGGPRDIIVDRVNGLLVAPNDSTALAGAVRLLIRDPDLRTNIQNAAVASVRQRFTLASTEGRLEKYLCDLSAAKNRVVNTPAPSPS